MESVYDANLRLDNLRALKGGAPQKSVDYGYDTAGRLHTVAEGSAVATYSYVPNSPLVSQILFQNGGSTRLTTLKDYDQLNRLKSIHSTVQGSTGPASTAPQFAHGYQYNAANQRERQTLANGAYWDYDYDALGQVTAGRKRWVDNAPVAGQQFEYAFDEIGNRLSTQAGGDASGGNLRLADYDVNRLNQYERRTVPAAMDVIGAAPAGSNVTVNTQSVERRGAYYRQELSIPNSSTSVWQTVDVDVAPLGSVDKTGKVFVPKSPEMFAQDADGNLTQDGRWNYTWDAENRLIKQASRTDAPSGSEKCLVFEYDYRGRRIGKQVWNNTAGTGTAALDERYLYDGWNLAAVINSSSALTKFFVWGLDLSGTMQGAGGVGGLLWGRFGALIAPQFAAYDGNGNVSALVSGLTGGGTAQYEYGPFGELIRATGTMAKNNPFRFSTKYQDDETDQLYYGYRFYNPSTGRWPNRDPLGDEAFSRVFAAGKSPKAKRRLYAEALRPSYLFSRNGPVNWVDALGLQANCSCGPDVSQAVAGHLNDFIQQKQGNLNPLWPLERTTMSGAARRNGQSIRNAAAGIQGCGGGPCTGTFTLCGMCISGRHIDHIFVMAYLAESYGEVPARTAGQLNESILLGIFSTGEEFEGSSNDISNADLSFNEIALCLSRKLKHKDATGGAADLITLQEICECTKAVSAAQRGAIAKKQGSTAFGSSGYQDCKPCSKSVQKPANLTLPPIDLP